MTTKNQNVNAYWEMKISGMSQQELIVFLYESSLRLLEEARETIQLKDVPGTHEKLSRARNIFVHLLSTLNLEAGGDFAARLSTLYAFFIEKITVANVTKNTAELDQIIPLIVGIKDAWATMKYEESGSVSANRRLETKQAISVEV
jgi:flagellar secretion chaperone FliS